MGATKPIAHIPFFEDPTAPQFFISGIERIEMMQGGLIRIVNYVERCQGGKLVHAHTVDLVRPLATWPQVLRMLDAAMAKHGDDALGALPHHLARAH